MGQIIHRSWKRTAQELIFQAMALMFFVNGK